MAAACATAAKRAMTKIFNLNMAMSVLRLGVLEGDLPWLLYLSCEREKPDRGLADLLPPRRVSKIGSRMSSFVQVFSFPPFLTVLPPLCFYEYTHF